jgi:carbohydrate diacid regulator
MFMEKRMQKILDKLVRSLQVETDILDANGLIVASSDKSRIGGGGQIIRDVMEEDDKAIFIDNNRTYMKFTADKTLTYFLSMEGTDRVARNYCLLTVSLLEAQLKNSLQKLDKEEVMRRILLNQLGELELRELVSDYKLELAMPRCVYLVRTLGMEADSVYQMLLKAFPRNQGDILVLVDGMTVSLIKDVSGDIEEEELLQLAAAIEETIENETKIKAYIGIGGIKENLFQLQESYDEASRAIEVGKIYNTSNKIYKYSNLLLERFLYEVPLHLCERYSKGLFVKEYKKLLSEEMLRTIDKFFENSLNLSETSRQLFIHRNTLVYRLDKIQKVMGLDLRNFHQAVTFKIMMMLMDRYTWEG